MDNKPFFIVGSGRSGTTLLRLMLNEHSRLRIPEESWFIPSLMERFSDTGRLGEAELQSVFEIVVNNGPWRRLLGRSVTDDELRQVISSLRTPTVAEVVDAIFRQCANPQGKPRWGDKTPEYVRLIQDLHRFFPEAKFIHIIRDGRDVCLSQSKTGWHGPTILHPALHWTRMIKAGRRAGGKLGPNLYLEIKYEDLVLNSRGTLGHVCFFLREEFEEDMLSFYKRAAIEVAAEVKHIHVKTTRPPQPTDVRRWSRELSALQIAIIELVAGNVLDEVGYKRRYPAWMLPTPVSRSIMRLAELMAPMRKHLIRRYPSLTRRI